MRKIIEQEHFGQVRKFICENGLDKRRIKNFLSENEYMERIISSLSADDIFIDIGAAIGTVSIYAYALCKRVIAVEPDPLHVVRLRQNIEINNLDITILELAIGPRSGEAKLYTDNTTDGVCPSMMDELEHKTFTIVEMITLNDLCFAHNPTVIKMDIEGYEYLVLFAAERTLSRPALRKIFLEIHPRHSGNAEIEAELKELFNKHNFKCAYRNERGDEIITEWLR